MWFGILLTLVPAVYLVFTWFFRIGETELIRPDFFIMVSYADVYSETTNIARLWKSESELIEARFFIYPTISDRANKSALFSYRSSEEPDFLIVVARYEDESYSIRPLEFFSGFSTTTTIGLGNGSPLPENFVFQDSLLAFEYLKSENETQITRDYSNTHWPMILIFHNVAPSPNWELCYFLRNTEPIPNCFEATDSAFSQ
jgi:hypothetical protein